MIPGLGRSPGGGQDNPFQYSVLENSMGCIVHGVAKSQTRLSDFHFSWQNNFLLYMCTTSLSILLDGHLACHVLAIVNSAAMNIEVYVSF